MGHEDEEPGDNTGSSQNDQALRVVHHKVTVKGSGGVAASIVVSARRGNVWLSIQPPFTWAAIMEPGKLDELVRALGLAAGDAKKMVHGTSGAGGNRQPGDKETALSGNNAVGANKKSSDAGRSRVSG
jgi:hypothetical protein